jgi:hypothetical protein
LFFRKEFPHDFFLREALFQTAEQTEAIQHFVRLLLMANGLWSLLLALGFKL